MSEQDAPWASPPSPCSSEEEERSDLPTARLWLQMRDMESRPDLFPKAHPTKEPALPSLQRNDNGKWGERNLAMGLTSFSSLRLLVLQTGCSLC